MSDASCPLPHSRYEHIILAHGGGGTLMDRLIQDVFRATFANQELDAQCDASTLSLGDQRLAFTTDSFVVNPIFFPGGTIGSLAVHGTVNDLAMSGAVPVALSAGFILEEGFPMDDLKRVVDSMHAAARQVGVPIVTGDTKVVERGKGDGVYINTSGVGRITHGQTMAPAAIREGDCIVVSGDVGRHGIAVLAAREGLQFQTDLQSDSASLSAIVQALLENGITIRCMRDLTRGGLTSALNEIAQTASRTLHIEEKAVPVTDAVKGACEMLGLDPLGVANEGRLIAFVDPADVDRALEVMHSFEDASRAARIGHVTSDTRPMVTLTSTIGATRILDRLSGEQLPRIC